MADLRAEIAKHASGNKPPVFGDMEVGNPILCSHSVVALSHADRVLGSGGVAASFTVPSGDGG